MPERNPYACHPLLRKGGAHIESKTARRSRDRQLLLDEAYECLEERESEKAAVDRKEKDSPSCFFIDYFSQNQMTVDRCAGSIDTAHTDLIVYM